MLDIFSLGKEQYPGTNRYSYGGTSITNSLLHREGAFAKYKDPGATVGLRNLPCPAVVCNFLAQDFTRLNGPTRIIPGTQHSKAKTPTLEEEPEWMRLSTLYPVPAGSAMIRDLRTWHGGMPNLSDEMRAIPNAIFLAPWIYEPQLPSMPREIFNGLSKHGQRISKFVVTNEAIETGHRIGKTKQKK